MIHNQPMNLLIDLYMLNRMIMIRLFGQSMDLLCKAKHLKKKKQNKTEKNETFEISSHQTIEKE